MVDYGRLFGVKAYLAALVWLPMVNIYYHSRLRSLDIWLTSSFKISIGFRISKDAQLLLSGILGAPHTVQKQDSSEREPSFDS